MRNVGRAHPGVVRQANDSPSSLRMTPVEQPDSRFTQANERTFLAWNRTALAFIGGGLAIEQLLDSSRPTRLAVSIPLILLGGFLGVAGYLRWRTVEDAIRRGVPVEPSRVPLLVAGAFVMLTIGALALVIASSR
ncbi:MAG: putative rane protein [Thermoleophilaceae bacterium]|nr:putative rane protein [Thermoleophilaceae bacterium]